MISSKFSKKVIYTAITGEYDELIKPQYVNDDWDYICFTDNPSLRSDFWKIIKMEETGIDPIRKARKYKVLPHKYLSMYDCSLWIDAAFDIIDDIDSFISNYHFINNMLCIMHSSRRCIYQEAIACVHYAKDYEDIIQRQIEKYRAEGYPEYFGLIESGVLFRVHSDVKLQKVMQDWWNEIEMFSRRDQLSFNYVCWKNHYTYDLSYLYTWSNRFFRRSNHKGIAPDINPQLFWKPEDHIENYTEDFSKKKKVPIENDKFNVTFYMRDCKGINNTKTLRFDPTNHAIILRKIEATAYFADGLSCTLEVLGSNYAKEKAGLLYFNHHDPQIEFASDMIDWDSLNHIVFSGELILGLKKRKEFYEIASNEMAKRQIEDIGIIL